MLGALGLQHAPNPHMPHMPAQTPTFGPYNFGADIFGDLTLRSGLITGWASFG